MKPNVVFVFGDQHRLFDVGYAENTQVKTPFLDSMRNESCEFTYAISGCPVCCPYRATLMTGQYPLTHGIFMNDAYLNCSGKYLGEVFKDNGYETAYIGKWHIDGHGRESYIPPERRRGFDFWRVLECTHDYNHSPYFGDDDVKHFWDGYDAFAQTDCAIDYIKNYTSDKPMFMILSYGPPHNPYQTAPEEFRNMYNPKDIILRENVNPEDTEKAQKDIAGYYAHISALDFAMSKLHQAIIEKGIENNTIFIYTSDHGDMLYSQGQQRKQRPWEESIRVPFLMKYPALFGKKHTVNDKLFNSVDIMPTLLGLCGIDIPDTVEGTDFSPYLKGEATDFDVDAVILECIQPFGEFAKIKTGTYPKQFSGGREYRGIRTKQYTYVADLNGAWLLYDNETDPYQKANLIENPNYRDVAEKLDLLLRKKLNERGDEFLPGNEYIKKWNYTVDATGTIPYGK